MKKILIYVNEDDLAPSGGPKGYNFSLKVGLDEIDDEEIQVSFLPGKSQTGKAKEFVNKFKNIRLREFLNILKSVINKTCLLYGKHYNANFDLNQYDFIHFHSTADLYRIKESLKNFKGKTIITTHTPTRPSSEIYDLLSPFEKKYMKWFYKKLPEIDEYAFDSADYIIFPCVEAEEPYYHIWDDYDKVHQRNKEKYKYMLTGTIERKVKSIKTVVRKKYGIPEDAFVISYVGRHNEIKGYDRLKELGKEILDGNNNIYFLIAGKEEPLSGLENERWIEVGWTNDPMSIINAADVFILPNKETYFDLVLLELLSIGQIVIASNTGGNKVIGKLCGDGVMLYNSLEEAFEKMQKLNEISAEAKENLRVKNRKIYETYFTPRHFAERYLKIIREL